MSGPNIDVDLERLKANVSFHSQEHVPGSGVVREVIFGFNDGLVSTFALVAGVSGAVMSNAIVLLAGVAGMLSGAISMGLGAYISSKSQMEVYRREIEREKQEIEEKPSHEKAEIREIYRRKGFKGKELENIVKKISSNKDVWLQVMMVEELGLGIQRFDNPVKLGAVMFVAFVVGALIPVVPYVVINEVPAALQVAAALSLVGLFAMGSAKTVITKRSWLKSGIEMVVVGSVAAVVTYFVGTLISPL
jgi:VIT1/CCC1 family predicted Fe2+/Mn2+ transporter